MTATATKRPKRKRRPPPKQQPKPETRRPAAEPAADVGSFDRPVPPAVRRHDRVTIKGETFVLVPEDEHRRDAGMPPLPAMPPADAAGNRPAVGFARASIARTVVRMRESVGLTQRQLAAAAGITPAMLCRVETAAVSATVATLTKIENAVRREQAKLDAARHAAPAADDDAAPPR